MAESVEIHRNPRQKGLVPKAINSPSDAPTVVVDGLTGGSVGTHMVRLNFVEHVTNENETVAKHVLTLAFDVEQFGKFATAITMMAEQTKAPGGEEA